MHMCNHTQTHSQECLETKVAIVSSTINIVLDDGIKCQLSRMFRLKQLLVGGVIQGPVQELAEIVIILLTAR